MHFECKGGERDIENYKQALVAKCVEGFLLLIPLLFALAAEEINRFKHRRANENPQSARKSRAARAYERANAQRTEPDDVESQLPDAPLIERKYRGGEHKSHKQDEQEH